MKKAKAVIFDFDGTIADSFDVIVHIFKDSSTKKPHVTDQEIANLRQMSAREVISELNIPWWRVPWLIYRARRELTKHLDQVELFNGLTGVFEKLKAQGYTLYILSSNSEKNIRLFLNRHRINHFFKGIYGQAGIFGKGRRLKQILAFNQVDPQQSYYIGDEVRDIEAANRANLKIIAVTWGFNAISVLKQNNPDLIAEKPTDISELVR